MLAASACRRRPGLVQCGPDAHSEPEPPLKLSPRKLGLLSYAELGRRLKFTTGGDLHSSYAGWAVKQGSSMTG